MVILLADVYEYDDDSLTLYQSDTKQKLVLLQILNNESEILYFKYSDEEVESFLSVDIVRTYQDNYFQVKFNEAEVSYGLWRRLVFFLLDALPTWSRVHIEKKYCAFSVKITGGWKNGVWLDSAVLYSQSSRGVANANVFRVGNPRYQESNCKLFPLHKEPVPWLYHDAQVPSGEMIVDGEVINSFPKHIRLTVPAEKQLSHVSHLYRKDKKAFFFLRYLQTNFDRGEDYRPMPYYGYLNEYCSLTMRAHFFYGVDTFFDWTCVENKNKEFFLPDRVKDVRFENRNVYLDGYELPYSTKEELFFALNDIYYVLQNTDCPRVFEREDDYYLIWIDRINSLNVMRGLTFGANMYSINWRPFSSNWGNRAYFKPRY